MNSVQLPPSYDPGKQFANFRLGLPRRRIRSVVRKNPKGVLCRGCLYGEHKHCSGETCPCICWSGNRV